MKKLPTMPPIVLYIILVGASVLSLVEAAVVQSNAVWLNQQVGIIQQQERENKAATLLNRATGQDNNRMLRAISATVHARATPDVP